MQIDVASVAPAGVQQCTIDVIAPGTARTARPAGRPVLAVCLPGGYMTRRYFDLSVPPAVGAYSMARHLAGRGITAVLVDPPGVGDSDRADDPYALTPDALADVVAAVVETVVEPMRADPSRPDPLVVGVGHSAGALLTVYTQARHRPYDAVALLGFAGHGLVEHLTEAERACADDPAAARAALPGLVRERLGSAAPDPPARATSIFSGGPEPAAVKDAMRAARGPLLAMLGLTSMIPGASAPELAAIDVPVFLGVGERDITGDPDAIPAQLPGATDVMLYVLADAGHAHNTAPTRMHLWDALADWIVARA